MLIWVCAMHCEAKPVIDFYRLKKSHENNAFDIYQGDEMTCIVSGIGKLASAAATAWVAARHDQQTSIAWINLGTAGAADEEVGAIFALNKVMDADSGQRYYPAPGAASVMAGRACLTLSTASEDYQANTLFDMEASGYLYSALRFSSAELTQGIKVVSDNRDHKTGKNRSRTSTLIHQHMALIDQQATGLMALNQEIRGLAISTESWQQLTSLAHFSQTQKNRLRVLWRYLQQRHPNPETLMHKLDSCGSSKAIIETLEELSHQDSAGL